MKKILSSNPMLKSMTGKILAALLIILTLASLFSACAGNTVTPTTPVATNEPGTPGTGDPSAETPVTSGVIGDENNGIIWKIADIDKIKTLTFELTKDSDGKITSTITAIPDYAPYTSDLDSSPTPWKDGFTTVTKIVIGEGITRVGKNAFSKFAKVTAVIFPETLEEIGENAFKANAIPSVYIPQTTKKIEDGAFGGGKLTTVYYGGYGAAWDTLKPKIDDNIVLVAKLVCCAEGMGFTLWSFDFLAIPLSFIIKGCYFIFRNYALAVLGFAIIIKLLLFPLGIKQQKGSQKQAAFAPIERAIRKRYAGRKDQASMQAMNKEIQDAKTKAGVPMMAGCGVMLLQLPVLLALYSVIRSPLRFVSNLGAGTNAVLDFRARELFPIEYGKGGELGLVSVLKDHYDNFEGIAGFTEKIASPDKLPNFNLLTKWGPDLGLKPWFTPAMSAVLLFIPVLVFASMYISMKLTRRWGYKPPVVPTSNDEDKPSMAAMFDMSRSGKLMDFLFPMISVVMSFTFPAILGLYWIYQSFIGIGQSYALSRMYPLPKFTEEEYDAAERKYRESVKHLEPRRATYSSYNEDDFNGPIADRKQKKPDNNGNSAPKKHNPKSLIDEDYDDEPSDKNKKKK